MFELKRFLTHHRRINRNNNVELKVTKKSLDDDGNTRSSIGMASNGSTSVYT